MEKMASRRAVRKLGRRSASGRCRRTSCCCSEKFVTCRRFPCRSAGIVHWRRLSPRDTSKQGNYVPTMLPRRYDAFCYFDESERFIRSICIRPGKDTRDVPMGRMSVSAAKRRCNDDIPQSPRGGTIFNRQVDRIRRPAGCARAGLPRGGIPVAFEVSRALRPHSTCFWFASWVCRGTKNWRWVRSPAAAY